LPLPGLPCVVGNRPFSYHQKRRIRWVRLSL
jgi:hypothetical protein